MPDNGVEIHQKLGQLIEANGRARDDRREMREDMGRLYEALEAIRHQLNAVQQTGNSIAGTVAELSIQKCGERLTQLEMAVAGIPAIVEENRDRIKDLEVTIWTWKKWLGTGWTFAGRLVLALAASGVFWASVGRVSGWVASHF